MKILNSGIAAIALITATPALAQEAALVEEVQPLADAAEHSAEKLALAEAALDLYWPEGNAQAAADYMLGPWMDRMLDSPISELAEPFQPVMETFLMEMGSMFEAMQELEGVTEEDGESADMPDGEEEDPASEAEDAAASIELMMALFGDMTIRQMIADEDPHFDERLSIFRAVMDEELPALLTEFEGPLRASLTQVFADRFNDAELAEIAAFADTPAGEKFAANMLTIGFEPEYFAGVLGAMPGMIKQAPPMVEKLEARMAHLPPMFPEPEVEPVCETNEDGEEICTEPEAVEEEDYSMSAEELEQWADELEAEAAELRRQAEEARAAQAAE